MPRKFDHESVVGVYGSFRAAQAAVEELEASRFPGEQISFVARSVHEELRGEAEQPLQLGDSSERSAAKLATMGGVLGLAVGTPLILIPGLGPMLWVGPIATGLTGAIVGGFLGAMSGWGVHEDHVAEYERRVREGQFLVIANGEPDEIALAKRVLDASDALLVRLHAADSADAPEIDDRALQHKV